MLFASTTNLRTSIALVGQPVKRFILDETYLLRHKFAFRCSSTHTQRYKIGVKYIGTNLSGFTKSSEHILPSVESVVCRALTGFLKGSKSSNKANDAELNDTDIEDSWQNFRASSRTDAGVHALRNSFHVDIIRSINKSAFSPAAVANGLNNYISQQSWKSKRTSQHINSKTRSIVITDATKVDSTFDARESATSRIYVYNIVCPTTQAFEQFKHLISYKADESATTALAKDHIITHHAFFEEHRAWCVYKPLNVKAMQEAADFLRNDSIETDYSSFQNSGCNSSSPMRTILKFEVVEIPSPSSALVSIAVRIEATSFLLRMVRNLVGVLVAVGKGTMSTIRAKELLKERNRAKVLSKPAPAAGLFLQEVKYDSNVLKRHTTNKELL